MTYYIECKDQTNAAELECLINSGEKYKATQEDCLVKFEKIESMRNLESDYERGMREAMKDIAKSCGKTFSVDIGYLELPKLVDSLVNKDKPKPLTKVVHEPLQCVHKWQLVKAVEDGDNGGEQIYVKVGGEYDHATPSHAVDLFCTLYRKVEKKIDWRDELVDLVGCGLMQRMGEGFQIGGVYFPEIVIRDIAHFVQPITDKP